jgi:hypothetical protein
MHRIQLITLCNRTIDVARRIELAPLLDSTYDEIDQDFNSQWARVLGAHLAQALMVPIEGRD